MVEDHVVIGEKLHVYRRANSPHWQCSAYLAGRNHRATTKESDLKHAKKVAEDWYLSGETILEISVRGKRGVGYCKSMTGAVKPFERLKSRKRVSERKSKGSWGGEAGTGKQELALPKPADLLFPDTRHHHLNAVLEEEGLKFDREGQRRTAYSLRHTYISMRLMEGADIYQIAKNTRTSVEMIQNFYAAHIKNMIDAAAVNVRRAEPRAVSKPKANAKGAPAKSLGHPKRRAGGKRPGLKPQGK